MAENNLINRKLKKSFKLIKKDMKELSNRIDSAKDKLKELPKKSKLDEQIANLNESLKVLEESLVRKEEFDSEKKGLHYKIDSVKDNLQVGIEGVKKELERREKLTGEIKFIRKIRGQLINLQGVAVTKKDFNKSIGGIAADINKLKLDFSKREDLKKEFDKIKGLSGELENIKEKIVQSGQFAAWIEKFKERLIIDIKDVKDTLLSKKEFEESSEDLYKKIALIEDNIKDIEKVRSKAKGIRKGTLSKKRFNSKIKRLEHGVNEKLQESFEEIKKLKEDMDNISEEIVSAQYFDQQFSKINNDINKVKDSVNKLKEDYVEKKEIEQQMRDIVLTNKSLSREVKKLKIMREEDKRFQINKEKIERKMTEMRDERVEDIKSTLLYVFVGLLTFGVFLFFYLGKNPLAFPGLKPKILLGVLILGVIVILLFLPYRRIIPKAEQLWFSFRQWLKLWKYPYKKEKPVKKIEKHIKVPIKKVEITKKPKKILKPAIKIQREYIKKAISFVFQVSLVAFLLALLVNEFKQITFINLNYFLIFIAVFGILSFAFPVEEIKVKKKKNYVLIVLIGLVGGFFIYLKTKQLGWLSYIIGIVSCVLIIMLSSIMIEDEE